MHNTGDTFIKLRTHKSGKKIKKPLYTSITQRSQREEREEH